MPKDKLNCTDHIDHTSDMLQTNQQIAKRFHLAASDYEKYALAQHKAAERFEEWLSEQAQFNPQHIVEIGCGTGFLTRRLRASYPHAHIHATDIAPAMLEHCRHTLIPASSQLHFALADGRNSQFAPTPDWIVSAMCFQWLNDLPKVLAWHQAQSKVLAFSLLLNNSFSAWRNAHKQHGLCSGLRTLPSWQFMQDTVKALPAKRTKSVCINFSVHHQNGLEFARVLRQIGADQPRDGHRPQYLRPVLRSFEKGFEAYYEIGFFWIEK
ncbi:MAG: methyltransferase domain-containing protein [Ottowia sp.]|nr:methyltransferase domain-containing protein [Ottowia sp.]